MAKAKIHELEKVLEDYSGNKILIALAGHPDPDCISSALAHQKILKSKNIESTITHVLEISHQENRALVKLLGIEMIKYDRENLNPSEFAGYSLVDSQKPDQRMQEFLSNVPLVSVVDHHDKTQRLEAKFVDINKGVGAAATVYADYLKSLDLLKEDDEKDSNIATALMHGIRSDTDNLINAKPEDHDAMAYLSKFADLRLLKKISLQALSPKTMDLIVLAYTNRDVRDNYLLTGVGVVKREERDAIPQAADFLLRRTGIDTVLVYGVVDDVIECSLRTTSDSLRPFEFIRDAFPDVQEGSYGGRYDKGGFQLPLGIFRALVDTPNKEILIQATDSYMQQQFYKKLGIQKETDETE